MKFLAALVAGLVFGAGLSLGGMTDPAVVLGFLDVFGQWNARLVFVMGGAVFTTAIGYRWVLRRPKPLYEATFQLPTVRALDTRLVGGAALFGIGWGIAGYCPGPVFASLSGGATSVWLLLLAMLAGWWLAARLLPVQEKVSATISGLAPDGGLAIGRNLPCLSPSVGSRGGRIQVPSGLVSTRLGRAGCGRLG